jgi:hypothetical protein
VDIFFILTIESWHVFAPEHAHLKVGATFREKYDETWASSTPVRSMRGYRFHSGSAGK